MPMITGPNLSKVVNIIKISIFGIVVIIAAIILIFQVF